jgi:uncharacterized membrane protein YpjA
MNLFTKVLLALGTAMTLYVIATIAFWIIGALGLLVRLAFVGLLIFGVWKACVMLKDEFRSDEN